MALLNDFVLFFLRVCMSFVVWFFKSVVAFIRYSMVINKANIFASLVFFTVILPACAMPAKACLESGLDQEQLSASQTNNDKNAHAVFSSDAFAAVRSSIGGAQLNELGAKIPIALAEAAINKTEDLINYKANEMADCVSRGKTQISLRQLETKNPEFSIRTIQPLTDLTDESTQLTFTQAQVSSGENHGERRATFNLGIGQRYLLEDGQSIVGINLFTDYETESKHSRASLGLEYRRANFSANVNTYHPLSDKVVIGDYTEEPLAGYDIRLTGQVPYLPWAKIKATQYYWDATTGDNIKGTSLGVEADINASTTFEIGTEKSNIVSRSGYARIRVQLPYNANPASTHYIIADKAFEDSTKLSLTDLNYVERSNKIRIEKLLNDDDEVFATVVIGTQTWSASNVSLVPTAPNTLGTHYWDSYGGVAATADNDGYYYTWDAAQNVCPSGWRLPSDADWKALENYLGMSSTDQNATDWRGTDEGTQLKAVDVSGFEAKLAGHHNADSGSFVGRGGSTHLWSSTESVGNAYGRYLHISNAKVYRFAFKKAHGFGVRCLKN
jgi:uncharacterized protein (TIGR02145 family)